MKLVTPALATLAIALAATMAQGQPPYARPVPESPGERGGPTEASPDTALGSRWLSGGPTYGADIPVGPPIGVEVYLQSGFSMPINSIVGNKDLLGRDMRTGFVVQGGVRTLFYNDATTRAWVVDASLSHYSNGHNRDVEYPLRVLDITGTDFQGQPVVELIQFGTPTTPGVRIRDTDRSYVNLGIGRDYFIFGGAAEKDGGCWRWGWDTGGKYGCLSQEYDVIKHRTDVTGGVYVGLHADVLLPTRWGVFTFGGRTEWAYTWSDILQRASDIEEINLMLSLGWRY